MRNYDSYTPEIQYPEEKEHDLESKENGRSGGNKRHKSPKSAISSEKTSKKKDTTSKIEKPEEKKDSISLSRFFNFFKSQSFKIISGIFLGCLTVYLGISFISYFSTCIEDQSKIAISSVGSAVGISNPGGEGGARLSELVINRGFGVGSLVIIIWLGALSLKLLVGKPKFRTLDFTIKCIVALITLSLIIGLLTYSMHTSVNWGGYHGTYVNEFIINFIGGIGAILLSFFMVAVFVVICLRDLVNWIMRVRNERRERRRLIAEEKAERKAREDEIRRMQEQEKIDDLKAGEATVLNGTDNNDAEVKDETLEFGNENLYEIPDENDYPSEKANPMPSDESLAGSLDGEKSADAYSTDGVEENIDEPEDAVNTESEESENEKMVVNVNTIDQTDKKHYTSDIERLEAHKYNFPPFDLMVPGVEKISVDAEEQLENKEKIRKTLLDFGIPITRIEATVGPTVTLYEIVPDTGVKISKIRGLVDDIGLRLSAMGVRIIAPIPGKGTVGIEVANKDPQTVSMQTVLKSRKFQESHYALPIALGSTISNDVYIADLAKMPHLLVAGATGQGKSVGLNAIITSLLYCKAPHELKFVMIDPKQVEFSLYNKIKDHYMAMIPSDNLDEEPVITDMQKVEATLRSLCVEMENRYTLLKIAGARKIEEYNAKIHAGKLNPAEGHRFLPYIVVIVDEFGDLVMVSGKNVEMPIARLAQKARAVGMHVIIATQRPSTNVITGIIKANFPARMSFKVSSGVDSKTILDTSGAQQLIGRGDMLIFHNSEMVRVQCAFIDTPEVERICEYVERQPYPQLPYLLPEPPAEGGDGTADAGAFNPGGERDSLFADVARAVVNSGTASTSSIQRHFSIGYVRAGKIMDQLERNGIVGPSQGGKPRAILVDIMGLESVLNSAE